VSESRFVILGGGMVAGYAAKQLVELGLKSGELTILSADAALPYERPPLSKSFLAGKDTEETIRINAENFYREHQIQVSLNCQVSSVDPARKKLALKSGGDRAFEKLVIATGAHPRTLDLPGGKLRNVHYLRSLDDSKSIRDSAKNVKHAVVIGGGFIGMEVAAVLAQKNIEVTMVLNDDRIWKKVFSPEMSAFFESYYKPRGVRFAKNAKIAEIRGTDAVSSVVLAEGQNIPCELVVAGLGVVPATEMLGNSGLDLQDGIVVNEYLKTRHDNIYAAGDVASYQDIIFRKRRRVEHWDNAVSQGQYCARALMGDPAPFKHVPYFFSDVFDLSYEYWGDASGADQVIHRGDLASKSFSVWWLRQKRIVAVFTMNRPDEEREAAPQWIEAKRNVSAAKMQDVAASISEALE